MAKKTVAEKPGYAVDDGVGVEWAVNKHGWGLERCPHMAVAFHPIRGTTLWGPFVDEDAARKWIREEGTAELLRYYGGDEATDSKWYAINIHVPTHEVN